MNLISAANSYSNKSTMFFVLVLYKMVLELHYVFFLNPFYQYYPPHVQFPLFFDWGNYVLSWAFYLVCCAVVPPLASRASSVVIQLMVLVLSAPVTVLYGLDADTSPMPSVLAVLFTVYVYFIAKWFAGKSLRLPSFKRGLHFAVVIAVMFTSATVIYYATSGSLFRLNFSLETLYEHRELQSTLLTGGLFSYISLWTYKVALVFLFCLALGYRRFYLAGALYLLQVLLFGVHNHKIALFLPFLSVGVWFYLSRTKAMVGMAAVYVLSAALSLSLYVWADISIPAEMIVRRALFVPADLLGDYLDFFSSNDYFYWAGRFFGLGENSYQLGIGNTVGEYLVSDRLNANNGLLGSGYANAGYLGVAIYCVLFSLIVVSLDIIGKQGVALWFVVALTIGPIRTALTDGDLLSSITSHGLAFSVLLILTVNKPVLNSRNI